ncbi:MAG: TonB-dependent receptor plug domain-containing protein, partial [Novosphingobium sp.]|nr:TonB-dependent receptor plug domain-containing protein [Novosphingobium sp.]
MAEIVKSARKKIPAGDGEALAFRDCRRKQGRKMKIFQGRSSSMRAGVALSSLAVALAMPVSAHAEEAEDDGKDPIVVTGTLLRGTEVVGAQTITVGSAAITEKAAGSTNELLSLIPQITNTFNGRFEGDPRGVRAGISINRPNLRSLPGFNRATGGVTLVLMNGMRLTPVGVGQSATDVDIIPTAVLAGVDAVTDGGTSLYGADAVAGVLNFRTITEYEGLKVDGNFG